MDSSKKISSAIFVAVVFIIIILSIIFESPIENSDLSQHPYAVENVEEDMND